MYFEKEQKGDILIIRMTQEKITSHEAPDVKTALLGIISEPCEVVIINLKSVKRMDSTGLGAFLFAIRQAHNTDKDVSFCEANEKIQFIIRIAHLEDIIEVYATEEEAISDWEEELKNV